MELLLCLKISCHIQNMWLSVNQLQQINNIEENLYEDMAAIQVNMNLSNTETMNLAEHMRVVSKSDRLCLESNLNKLWIRNITF